ncbi:MAG TPA: DUF3858 domain-containing protein, partial [Myxococcaceae bacterium]|nr:DUF3858 domain-containing protein [Myxococcaceae bacterium]
VLELRYRLDDVAAENLLSDYWGDVMPVQRAAPKVRFLYQVEMPKGRPLYSNASEIPGVSHSTESLGDGRTLYTWRANTVAQVLAEPSMPGWAEVASTLHVSTYRSWDDVGRYYWGLIRDQLTPTDEVKAAVRQVLRNVNPKDEAAIVRAVYDFVVTHTRYVALEFGIHGFKPYRVDRVLARRFGDCKDKASLIHSMLQVAGVDSRIVLLRMRDLGSLSGTPASLAAFNHAIVYVPGQDLWLDGTAEFHGAMELPGSDRLANVLVVEPKGESRFMTIPAVSAQSNLSTLSVDVKLASDGTASISGSQSVVGQNAPRFRSAYRAEEGRASTFERGWARNFPGVSVSSVKVSDTTDLSAPVSLSFELTVPRLARTEGTSLRVHPFGAKRGYVQSLAPLSERRHDLVLSMPWTERTTWRFELPAGSRIQALPKPVSLQTPYGQLTMSFREQGGQLVAESELSIAVARVKAEEYAAFRAFLTQVDQAFDRRIELVPGAQQASTKAGGPAASVQR